MRKINEENDQISELSKKIAKINTLPIINITSKIDPDIIERQILI